MELDVRAWRATRHLKRWSAFGDGLSLDLKKEFLRLLEEDEEFRYAVAGRIGILEILKRMDALEERMDRLWENQNKLWEEVRYLREGQNRLWESLNRLWESVKRLEENQNRLWENITKLWEEVKALREEYRKLRNYVVAGFSDLRSALGVTFEMQAASYLQLVLEQMGYGLARVERKFLVHDGDVIEINLFCEEPLVVGEVTLTVRSEEEAVREVSKLLKRIEAVVSRYGRRPVLSVLSVARATPEAAQKLRSEAEKHGIRLILGAEIEEALRI